MDRLKLSKSTGKAHGWIAVELKADAWHSMALKDQLDLLKRKARPQARVLEDDSEPLSSQKIYHRNNSSPASWVIKALSALATATILLRTGS